MKKTSFFLSLFVLLATALVGCKNPVVINEVVYEDKSPFEYKLPNSSIDLNDYRYVGDYIFSDYMDFTQWKYTNGTMYSQYGYFMVLEKISRVRFNGNGDNCFVRYSDNFSNSFAVEKGTRYKVYLKKAFIDSFDYPDTYTYTTILDIPLADSYDGSTMKIKYMYIGDLFLTTGSDSAYSTKYSNYMDIQ